MDAILTNYPLSRDFQERLRAHIKPDALKLSIGELRQRPLTQMLAYLRSLKVERLFLPMDDENGATLLPVLKLLASVIPARNMYLIEADLGITRISRVESLISAIKLAYASIAARVAVTRARIEMARLLRQERSSVDEVKGRHVLYLNANLWFGVKAGGSVGHISGVVNALLQKGYDVVFASAGGRLMVNNQAKYVQLTPSNFGLPWEYNYYRFHFDVRKQLQKVAACQGIDFIYQRLSIANYSGVVASRSLGIPLVLEYNGSEAWVARNWGSGLREQRLAEQVEEANLRHAHMIVTISDVLRDELLQRGVEPERIVTYPNCIDPKMFDPARFRSNDTTELRSRYGISRDAIVVTFVGTFGQWHGADVLALAIAKLYANEREWLTLKKVHFMLVGDGLKMPELRRVIFDAGAEAVTTLTGLVPQDQAPLHLAAADILVSPHVANADGSRFFGSPTKLFEYMAMGKGIAASRLDQIADVLTPSLDVNNLPPGPPDQRDATALAVLGAPGSVDDLVRALKFLVDREDWRSRLGANARKRALDQYTWEHHVDAILAGLAGATRASYA